MKKIGIIGAMELEVEALKAKMTIENTVQKASGYGLNKPHVQ